MKRIRLSSRLRFGLGLLVLSGPFLMLVVLGSLAAEATQEEAAAASLLVPEITFTSGVYSRNENAGTATISVRIATTPPITQTATVEYLAVEGTATSPEDYTLTPGTLTFTVSGPATQDFTVTIVDDTTDEPNETVQLVLRNPTNAALGDPNTATLTIVDNDPTPTNTPSAGTPTPVFVDLYEPNDSLQTAYTAQSDGRALCNITLWPPGDQDYFRFVGKAGSSYEVLTDNLDPGVDTVLTVFDTQGNIIAVNDDYTAGDRGSRVTFTAGINGFYFARIVNQSPADPADQTFCLEVSEFAPTPLPTSTRVPGPDACEYNGDFDTACLIGAGDTLDLNLVPIFGEGPDNDFFRLWVKQGIFYSCETFDLSNVIDTNMIIYDQNRNGLAGNDDKAPGDFGSKVSYRATYTGWLYILVGPVAPAEYALSYLYTYSLICEESVPPTATPIPTRPPVTSGGLAPATPTPIVFPTFPPTPTPFEIQTPEPTARPVVQIVPLPTATPPAAVGQTINVNATVYYDANLNFMPELTEGIEDLAVSLYDNSSGELLAFGYTNEAGAIRFASLTVRGAIRISVPYLRFSQIAAGDSNLVIRIAPRPLPANIP